MISSSSYREESTAALNRIYPKSFLRLILIGFILVALPLVAAVVSALITMERLAHASRDTVSAATVAARASRDITDDLAGMERRLRQYAIVRDPALFDDYGRHHRALHLAAKQLIGLPMSPELDRGLIHALEREERLYHAVEQKQISAASSDELVSISLEIQGLLDSGEAQMDQAVSQGPHAAEDAKNELLWRLLFAVVLALMIALWFKRSIGNQIRQVDQAIRSIGRAENTEGMTVVGTPDLAHLGRRLEWLRKRLAELEEQKTRFLRHISHDLKTPLTAIREGSQLLAERVPGELSKQQQSIVTIISQNSIRLQKLIEDLLDYQQATFAANTIEPQQLAFDGVCLNVLRAHQIGAAARGVRFRRSLTPIQLEGDADKLRVVVDNLLSNALKFAPPKSNIIINLHLHRDGARAVLDVVDEGPGVAIEEREQIFDAFFRGTRVRQGEIKGSGLGLAIAKEYVVAHGGTIELVDEEGDKGAHFRVILPLEWSMTA